MPSPSSPHPEPAAHPVQVGLPRLEHLESTLGIGAATPRISWQVTHAPPGWRQTAYEMQLNDAAPVRVDSGEQILVPWPFAPLTSRQQGTLRVRVWEGTKASDWSEALEWEVALLQPEDWQGRFIQRADHAGTLAELDRPAPVFRRDFELDTMPTQARLYLSSLGCYEAVINNVAVAPEEVLAPGWTSYDSRLRYGTYDVTTLLQPGANRIEITVGGGWAAAAPSLLRMAKGDDTPPRWQAGRAALAQLEFLNSAGEISMVSTDEQWQVHDSQVRYDDLYQGQHTDLTHSVGATLSQPVRAIDTDLNLLVPHDIPPVRRIEELAAQQLWVGDDGALFVDFGQVMVGWVRMTLSSVQAGTEIEVLHSEVLQDGDLCRKPLRGADARDWYRLPAAEELEIQPCFTFHGFRYAKISGISADQLTDIRAVVIGTDLSRRGWFDCSHELVNQFHRNVVWSARGNFVSIPTDCPNRDERLGWTGDVQAFAPTGSFLFDVSGFLGSWLVDLAADQWDDGFVPWVIPDPDIWVGPTAATGWGDAATVVPWVLHDFYADPEVLRRQFRSMRAWVDHLATLCTDDLWIGGYQFGDWLDPAAPAGSPAAARADHDLVASAYTYHSTRLVAEAAGILGESVAQEQYATAAARIRAAFQRTFVSPSGRMMSDAPTAYALAIQFGLLEADQLVVAGNRLADLVRTSDFRVNTGFLGTPVLLDALTTTGHLAVALKVMQQTEHPSWLYPVTTGATTIWERWDSMQPDGTVNPGRMNSFNHYALGAVADWLHRVVGGLTSLAPGFRQVRIAPPVCAAFTAASVRHESPFGLIEVSWQREGGHLRLAATVPVGVSAQVCLPDGRTEWVDAGRHEWNSEGAEVSTPEIVTIRDLLDSDLWLPAVDILRKHNVVGESLVAARGSLRYLDRPAESLASQLGRHHAPSIRGAGHDLALLLSKE